MTVKSCQRIGKTTACAYIKIIIKNVEKINLNKEITYCKLFGIFSVVLGCLGNQISLYIFSLRSNYNFVLIRFDSTIKN